MGDPIRPHRPRKGAAPAAGDTQVPGRGDRTTESGAMALLVHFNRKHDGHARFRIFADHSGSLIALSETCDEGDAISTLTRLGVPEHSARETVALARQAGSAGTDRS